MSVMVIPTQRDAQSPLCKDHKRDINFKSSFLRHFLRKFASSETPHRLRKVNRVQGDVD